MKTLKFLTLLLLSWLALRPQAAYGAEPERPLYLPATHVITLEAGGSQVADTYLSPLVFKGYALGIRYENLQAMRFSPEKWVMQATVDARWLHGDSPSRRSSQWYAGLDASWGMMRRWRLTPAVTLALGGQTGVMAGCVYNGRNSNNPASAKASWTVGLTGMASWSGKLGRMPITVSWQPTLPVTGAFFATGYGELYYEIWLGNHKGLAHWAHWGNYFAIDNAVMVDWRPGGGSTALRLGFRSQVCSTNINNLTTRLVNNMFVIGISGEWLSLSKAAGLASTKPRIIHAY